MDDFLAQIEQLDDGVSSVHLMAAQLDHADLQLIFQLVGENYHGEAVAQTWQITAHNVTEHRLSLGECQFWPELSPEYPRLLVTQSTWEALMFAAAPADTAAFLVDLRAIHDEKKWDTFCKYGLGEQIELGYGVFADGPTPLLELYYPILEAHKMRPSWMPSSPRPTPPQACLQLGGTAWKDDLYVLAQGFEAVKLE